MSVVKLSIKNFLSISDVEIVPGKVNQIFGKNNQGKTTILKALEFAFKGSTDGSMVKHGEENAEVIVELDEMTIRRRLGANGKQSVSVTKGAFKADSPQAFLSSLFEGMSFNPLEILNPKTRTKFILKALNLKVSREELAKLSGIPAEELPELDYQNEDALVLIERAYQYFYSRRAEANRVVAEKKKRFETYEKDLPEGVEKPISKDQLLEKQNAIKEQQRELIQEKNRISANNLLIQDMKKKVERYEGELKNIDSQVQKLRENFERDMAVLEERRKNGVEALSRLQQEVPVPEESAPIDAKSAELVQQLTVLDKEFEKHKVWEAQEKQRVMVEDMEADWLRAQGEAEALSRKVEVLGRGVKEKIMESAELPVEGLSYEGGEFGLNGASIDHLSSSLALKLSLALVKKLTDKTKLICIDGAELLDEEAFASLKEEMGKDDYTYFFTKVGEPFEGADKTFQMSNGGVKQ